MQNCPLITIAITCYNAEKTIEKAIKSALSQDWSNYEIIVVDDCSNDKSIDIINSLALNNTNIKVILSEKNSGVAIARNKLIEHANGEFIAFFDDDDESVSQRLTKQYRRITEYEKKMQVELVISHTARLQIFPDGYRNYEATIGNKTNAVVPHSIAVADQILIGRPMNEPVASCATCSQMARKTSYIKVGNFNGLLRRSEDTDINVKFALAGAHFVGIDEPLVLQNMTYTAEKNMNEERQNALLFLDNHRTYLQKTGWYNHAHEWLDIKYDYLSGLKLRFLYRMVKLFVKSPKRTLQRLYWVWPNRQHSRMVANRNVEFHDER